MEDPFAAISQGCNRELRTWMLCNDRVRRTLVQIYSTATISNSNRNVSRSCVSGTSEGALSRPGLPEAQSNSNEMIYDQNLDDADETLPLCTACNPSATQGKLTVRSDKGR